MATSTSWTALIEPGEAELRAVLPAGVHESVIGRLVALAGDELRPRLETHGEYVYGLLLVPFERASDQTVQFHQIGLVLTADRLVTAEHTSAPEERPLCAEVQADSARAGDGPARALHRLVDEIAERFLGFVDDVDAEIDDLEDNVADWPSDRVRSEISRLRHEILRVRRALTPTRDVARAVLDDRVELEGADLFPREVEVHFADTYDKLLRAADDLELSRDLLAGVRDYHQAQIATVQNEVVKRLTAIASLLLLPTFIVGLYGQNLRGVPEFDWPFGYAWSWGVIVATTVAQLVWFRRRRWI